MTRPVDPDKPCPRANPGILLERYAALRSDEDSPTYGETAPAAFAALQAVLNLHKPATLMGPAYLPDGNCLHCHLGEPVHITPPADGESHPIHTHEARGSTSRDSKACGACEEDWPCPTIHAVGSALEQTWARAVLDLHQPEKTGSGVAIVSSPGQP